MRTRRTAAVAALLGLSLAIASPPTAAQGKPDAPRPSAGPRGGVGVTLDLGSLFRLLAPTLGGTQSDPGAPHVPGRLLVLRAGANATVETTRVPEAREAARFRLEALDLTLVEFAVEPGAESAAVDALARALPDAVVDRMAWLDPQQGPAARLYAAAAIRLPTPMPLPEGGRPRLGVIDAAPTQDLPLAGTLRIERFDGDAPGHAHADAVLCLLACRADADSGFRGLLPEADITLIAILERAPGDRLRGSTLGLARALDRLLALRVPVANLSLGGAGDAVQRAIVERALGRGLVLIAAAGNGGPDAPPVYPAAWPGVIAVAAHDAADRPYARGNRGDYVTLAAPGVELWLPLDGGRYVSGTSFAAPMVAARLAWAAARGEPVTPGALCGRARDLGAPGRDPVFGCGALVW
jgi:hypothetical protein